MWVVWLILKIILWIILGFILLILGLLTIILIAPIRYKAQGEKYDDQKLHVKITWLWHILSCRYALNEEYSTTIKVFGITLVGEKQERRKARKEAKKKQKQEKKTKKLVKKQLKVKKDQEGTVVKDNMIAREETVIKIEDSVSANNNVDQVKSEASSREEQHGGSEQHVQDKTKKKINVKKDKEKSKKINVTKSKKTKKSEKNKKRKKDKRNRDKEENGWYDKYKRIKSFLKDENNKVVIKFLKKQILLMIKHILPRKFKAKVIVGTGDPATTGYIVGAASMVYAITGDNIQFIPDFHEQKIQGEFLIKGRIYLGVLVFHALRIIVNKRVRQLYKDIKG